MQGPESSKTYLAPKEPSLERAQAAVDRVRHFRDGQGHDLPVAVRSIDGLIVVQIGMNPGIDLVLRPAGAVVFGEDILAVSGGWRRVDNRALDPAAATGEEAGHEA